MLKFCFGTSLQFALTCCFAAKQTYNFVEWRKLNKRQPLISTHF